VESPASRTIPWPGECRAWYETTIYARVSGYVKPGFVDIGDHVKAGQVLATIETPEMEQQLATAQAKVNADDAQVKLAQANVHFAEVTLARYKDAPKGVVSDLERDEKEADYQISMARLTSADSNLSSSQSEVDRYKAMIAFQKVTATFDGIITQRRVDIGDLVTAGSTTNTTPLFMLAQSDKIRVFVEMPQSIAPEIHDGDKAIATAEQFPDRQFIGVVGRTSSAISDTSKTLRVEVDVPNADMSLLPGMFVRVNFDIKEQTPSLVIPASAINFRTGGPQVATVSSDGRVTFHNVKIARDLGDTIEIKSGLKVDDRVILNTSYQIANGDVVKANEMESPSAAPAVPKAQAAVVPKDPRPLQ
jgi:RND family efflux transporter MFP subunit